MGKTSRPRSARAGDRPLADHLPPDVACDLGSRGEGFHVVWELTAGCNLACLHCAVPRPEPGPRLGPERAGEVMEELVRAGARRISFSGGEPLLRKDLWRLVRRAVRSGLEVEIFTNGLLLEEEDVAAAVKAGRGGQVRLVVSLDSARDWVHDGIRGRRGAFAATVAGVRRARAAGLAVALVCVLTLRNRFEVAPLVDLARDLDVESVTFRRLVVEPAGRGRAEEIDLDGGARRVIFEEIRAIRAMQAGGPVLRTVGLEELPDAGTCGAARDIYAIDGQGDVHPCVLLRVPPHPSRSLATRAAEEILARPTLARAAAGRRPGCV